MPEQKLDYAADVKLLKSRKWPALLNRYEFANLTGQQSYPDELKTYINPYNELTVSSNAEIRYLLQGKAVSVAVDWDYDSEENRGDTFEGILQAVNFTVEVKSEDRRNIIYITPKESADKQVFEKNFRKFLLRPVFRLLILNGQLRAGIRSYYRKGLTGIRISIWQVLSELLSIIIKKVLFLSGKHLLYWLNIN